MAGVCRARYANGGLMESLYFLIPLSMVVVGLGIWLFFWAVNNGQYDDLEGEAERILFEPLEPHSNAEEGTDPMTAFRAKQKLPPQRVDAEND